MPIARFSSIQSFTHKKKTQLQAIFPGVGACGPMHRLGVWGINGSKCWWWHTTYARKMALPNVVSHLQAHPSALSAIQITLLSMLQKWKSRNMFSIVFMSLSRSCSVFLIRGSITVLLEGPAQTLWPENCWHCWRMMGWCADRQVCRSILNRYQSHGPSTKQLSTLLLIEEIQQSPPGMYKFLHIE